MDPNTILCGFEHYWKQWRIVEEWRRRHNEAIAAAQKMFTDVDSNSFLTAHKPFGSSCVARVDQWTDNESFNKVDVDNRMNTSDCEETNNEFKTSSSDCEDSSDDNFELEFVVNEDMIAFFEQSMRHKMELKKQRELENGRDSSTVDLISENVNKKNKKKGKAKGKDVLKKVPVPRVGINDKNRTNEMALLYGDAAPKICGMETAVQLSYNRLCDRNKPVHWPCISFRP